MKSLNYYKLYDDVLDLEFATMGSSCFDLRAHFPSDGIDVKGYDAWSDSILPRPCSPDIPLDISPGERVLVPTGLVLDIPFGHSVRLHPRSGLAVKKGISLANCVGVIDSDYVEPVYVAMVNLSQRVYNVYSGDRICQAELIFDQFYTFSVLDERPERKTSRAGGFGSTGTK